MSTRRKRNGPFLCARKSRCLVTLDMLLFRAMLSVLYSATSTIGAARQWPCSIHSFRGARSLRITCCTTCVLAHLWLWRMNVHLYIAVCTGFWSPHLLECLVPFFVCFPFGRLPLLMCMFARHWVATQPFLWLASVVDVGGTCNTNCICICVDFWCAVSLLQKQEIKKVYQLIPLFICVLHC